MKPKGELFRMVKTTDGAKLDLSYKMQGRGAYVCRNEKCILLAAKRHAFSRHLKTSCGDEVVNLLLGELENGN